MGHLLSTLNPVASERINGEGRPLPGVGEIVLYHPRMGEVRQQRKTVPAIVLAVDESNRLLEVLIIHAADDLITQNRLPEHVEGDRGWSRLPVEGDAGKIEALVDRLNALEVAIDKVFGDFIAPEGESVLSLIDRLDGRLSEVEDKVPVNQVAEPVKRGPGRPRRAV